MRSISRSLAIASLLLSATFAAPGRADDLPEKGREILNKYRHAVVTLELVQKAATPGRAAREGKQEITGTVVDPSGLIVVSLSACDPSELYRRLSEEYKTEIEITDMKIMLEDGTELPAEIVLRDKDQDLAFVRAKIKPSSPMEAVDLSKSGPVDVLDPVITLNRLKQAAGRAYSASVERVSAVVRKPRTFYIPDSSQSETSVGSPAFSLNGSIVGMVVMRAVNAQSAANYRDCITAIILPAEDIAKAAAQAPAEAKPDEEKKAATPDATKVPKDAAPKTDAPKESSK